MATALLKRGRKAWKGANKKLHRESNYNISFEDDYIPAHFGLQGYEGLNLHLLSHCLDWLGSTNPKQSSGKSPHSLTERKWNAERWFYQARIFVLIMSLCLDPNPMKKWSWAAIMYQVDISTLFFCFYHIMDHHREPQDGCPSRFIVSATGVHSNPKFTWVSLQLPLSVMILWDENETCITWLSMQEWAVLQQGNQRCPNLCNIRPPHIGSLCIVFRWTTH